MYPNSLDFYVEFLIGRDDHGFSPLHWAAKYGQYKIVELLLQRGARVNVVNKGDDAPLHLAAAHGHHDVVRLVSLLILTSFTSGLSEQGKERGLMIRRRICIVCNRRKGFFLLDDNE
jgi:ankyrin repeat protein